MLGVLRLALAGADCFSVAGSRKITDSAVSKLSASLTRHWARGKPRCIPVNGLRLSDPDAWPDGETAVHLSDSEKRTLPRNV